MISRTVALAGLCALATFFAWRHHDSEPSNRVANTEPASSRAISGDRSPAARLTPPPRPQRAASFAGSLDDRPFSEVRAELEQSALAGDARAARRLGFILSNCNHYAPVDSAQLENAVIDFVARGSVVKEHDRILSAAELLARIKPRDAQHELDCKNVSGVDEKFADRQAFGWIERAAALGDADAQALYGSLAFSTYTVRTALDDAERVRERRRLAAEYLGRSLAQGDGLALREMAVRYSSGIFVSSDPEKAYAYLYAYSLTPRSADLIPERLDQMLASMSNGLDDAARARARVDGQRLAECCKAGGSGAQ